MELVESNCKCCCAVLLAAALLFFLLFSINKTFRFHAKFMSYFVSVSLVSLGTIPFYLFNLQPHVKNGWHAWYVSTFLGYVCSMLGITWEIRRAEIMAEERGCVVMANHQSSLDTLGILMKRTDIGKLAPVVRKELFYFWPFGLVMWLGNTVFIDRHQPAKAKDQLKTAMKRVKDRSKLIFFPEGTRNHDGGSLLPFKKGAFHVAITCQVPIIPVVFSPYYFISQKNRTFGSGESFHVAITCQVPIIPVVFSPYYFISQKNRTFGSGKVIMKVLPPIPTEGLTDADISDLMERTRNTMLETYKQLSEEVKMMTTES